MPSRRKTSHPLKLNRIRPRKLKSKPLTVIHQTASNLGKVLKKNSSNGHISSSFKNMLLTVF